MAYQFRKFKRGRRDRIAAAVGHPTVGHAARHSRISEKRRHKLLKCSDMVYLPFRIIRANNHAPR